jgi:hypothetical protein
MGRDREPDRLLLLRLDGTVSSIQCRPHHCHGLCRIWCLVDFCKFLINIIQHLHQET